MTPAEAMERVNVILAHAWMVRTFLKHAEEIQDNDDMLAVPRTIFDFIRALEPSYQRKDAKEYLLRASGKLSKLRRTAQYFEENYRRVSDHTNYQMAAASLSACVRDLEATLQAAKATSQNEHSPPEASADKMGESAQLNGGAGPEQ